MAEQDWGEVLGDALLEVMRRGYTRSRKELSRAANVGRKRLETRQKQKDLDQFWGRLGKTAHRLVEAGEIDHPALRKAMARIEQLEQELSAEELASSEQGE